jgi:hypothetical protein
MADVKITELTVITPVETDILPVVSDPAGTPITKKTTIKSILEQRINYSLAGTDFTLTAGTGAQAAFPTTGDVFTLVANTTYEVEGVYYISKSGTTCTTALLFPLTTAVATFIGLNVFAFNAAANTTTPTVAGTWVNQLTATVVNATAVGEVAIKFKGLLRITTAGTVTPQIQFSAAPTTPLMKAGSYIKFTPIGTTQNVQGAFA